MRVADEAGLVRRAVRWVALARGTDGLAGLRRSFDGAGAVAAFDSWVSTDPNQPIDAPTIVRALGPGLVAMARATGREPTDFAEVLARVLPTVIDELTPDGVLPTRPERRSFGGLLRSVWRRQR